MLPRVQQAGAVTLALALVCCKGPPSTVTDVFMSVDGGGSDAVAPDAPPALHWPLERDPGRYIVLAADHLATVGAELADYRGAQGYATEVLRVSDLVPERVAPAVLARKVRGVLASRVGPAPTYLLLLGDAPGTDEETAGQIPAIPCTNHFGGCMTDNLYADINGDGLPDAAVGRIPARSVQQARAYLARLKAHEGSYTPGVWNRRLSLYTEPGGYGPQADSLIELGMMMGLKRVDHAFDIVGAYNNPVSSFYYTPFPDKVIDLFNQGNLFVFYVGHGLSGSTAGLQTSELGAIHCDPRQPGVFFFACHNGAYVGADESIAEAMLFKADGAIVAFASSDVSHPYGNASLVYEVTRIFLDQRPGTFGEGLRLAKHELIRHSDEFRMVLDTLVGAEVSPDNQPVILAEHVNLYNLLGDPATAVQYPRSTIAFDPVVGGLADGRLTVSGRAPGVDHGTALVTLEVERDVLLHPLEPLDPDAPDGAMVRRNWQKAVDKVVTGKSVPVRDGVFVAELTWTPPLPGSAVYVKVYAESATADSLGFLALP